MIIDDRLINRALGSQEKLFEFYDYDLDDADLKNALAQIESLVIRDIKGIFSEETLKQLNLLLDHMGNLKSLSIISRGKERVNVKSIFEHVNHNVEVINLKGVNLSESINDITENFKKINQFSVEMCNIPEIPIFPNKNCNVSLGNETSQISDESCINFALNGNRISCVNRDEVMSIVGAFRSGLTIPLKTYEKYKDTIISRFEDRDICISIENVGELSLENLESLKQNSHIKNIAISGGWIDVNDKKNYYSLDEYSKIRGKIDEIIENIEVPDINDPNKEKKIFTQVYRYLGKMISYDYYAISDEGKSDEELRYNCRNLKNAFIGVKRNNEKEYLTVCAGYADALMNMLSCFGIECKEITSRSSVQFEDKGGFFEEKKDEKGNLIYRNGTTDPMGHAYNLVILDGKKYYTDLTWDAGNIKVDRYPLGHFLKSYTEFIESHKDEGFDELMADKEAMQSITLEEQLNMFGVVIEGEIDEMIQENYLSGFVNTYLDYMKNDRNIVSKKEMINMIKIIKLVEDKILNRDYSNPFNMEVSYGENGESFTFETSKRTNLSDLKRKINERRNKTDDYESR